MADPINVGNCALWLDASLASSIHATGSTVDTWDDQSGNGRNVTATTTARPATGTRTLNGFNVLDFDGTSDRMVTGSLTVSVPWTVCAVVQNDSGADSSAQCILGTAGATDAGLFKWFTNFWAVSSANQVFSAAAPDTSAHSLTGVILSASTARIRVDGTESATGNAGNTALTSAAALVVGGNRTTSNYWNGTIAELVVYSAALATGDRDSIDAYFTNKWFTAPSPAPDPIVSPIAVHRAANW